MSVEDSEIIYERVIWADEYNLNQIKLVITKFREIEYIQIRKYYLNFDGDWMPTRVGISFPLEIESTKELFTGMAEIISLAESKEVIEQYFGDTVRDIYK